MRAVDPYTQPPWPAGWPVVIASSGVGETGDHKIDWDWVFLAGLSVLAGYMLWTLPKPAERDRGRR